MSQQDTRVPIPIAAIGAATMHGGSLAATQETLAKGRPVLRRRRDFIGADFKPLRCGFRPDQDLNQTVADRITHLAHLAIEDLIRNLGQTQFRDTGIAVAITLPEEDAAFALPSGLGDDLVKHIGTALSAPVVRHAVQRAGSAGSGAMLAQIMSDGWDGFPVLLLAVDSMASRARLAAQLDRGDLMSDANPYGLIPGEAAVAMMLADGNARAHILGAGMGLESVKEDDPGDSNHTGLSSAWWDALGPDADTIADHLWTDWNNGRYRAAQMSYAMVRTTPRLVPGIEPEHVALQFGDTGAAAQLLALTQALLLAQPNETALVSAHSRWSGASSAIFARRLSP